eukprot:m.200030 g.200030  ORF g.200030 m.200030 type:complete len:507 (-) comp20937_c0_seq1:58-1578(-)
MQKAVLVERVLFGIGVSLLVMSVLQYRAATLAMREGNTGVPFTLPGSRLAHLRPYKYARPNTKPNKDGLGIELVLGKRCLDASPARLPYVGLANCTWRPEQQFNWSHGQISITDIRKTRRCATVETDATSDGPTSPIVLQACNRSDPQQQWNFTQLAGQYRRFGTLVHNATGHCLTRVFGEGGHAGGERVAVAPCTAVNYSSCEQAWYLPRSYQHHFNASQPAAPLGLPKRPFVRSAGRILCWVLTHPGSHDTKARAVNRTWGSRCDKLLFITTEEAANLPARVLDFDTPEGRNQLWNKSKLAWMHVYEKYILEADWFVKADDDTYLSMSNMHRFLSVHNPADKHMFGRVFMLNGRPARTYVSGGSGIVLSRGSLMALGKAVNRTKGKIWGSIPHGPEDLQTADTLKQLGIRPGHAVDDKERQLFLPLGPQFEWNRGPEDSNLWFYRYSVDAKMGPECCSSEWIASHYVPMDDMYRLDNLEALTCPGHRVEWPHWQHSDWEARQDL